MQAQLALLDRNFSLGQEAFSDALRAVPCTVISVWARDHKVPKMTQGMMRKGQPSKPIWESHLKEWYKEQHGEPEEQPDPQSRSEPEASFEESSESDSDSSDSESESSCASMSSSTCSSSSDSEREVEEPEMPPKKRAQVATQPIRARSTKPSSSPSQSPVPVRRAQPQPKPKSKPKLTRPPTPDTPTSSPDSAPRRQRAVPQSKKAFVDQDGVEDADTFTPAPDQPAPDREMEILLGEVQSSNDSAYIRSRLRDLALRRRFSAFVDTKERGGGLSKVEARDLREMVGI